MNKYQLLINWFRLRELKNSIKKKKFSLLDLGCGDGLFLRLALRSNIDALGVDKLPPLHPKAISSSIEDLKLDKNFDVVTMFHVLEHVDKPANVLEKAKTFLKKEGVLVIEVPLVGNFSERFLQKHYFAYHDKTHANFFTKKELIELLDKAGFAIKGRGCVLLEFPLTIITTGFRKSFVKGIVGLILFLPLKLLSVFGLNDEIIRFYCAKK